MIDHCEEIDEAKFRAFKEGEMPEEWRDYWYRLRTSEDHIHIKPSMYFPECDSQILFKDNWISNSIMFTFYEVQKEPNGPWGIVGVEE